MKILLNLMVGVVLCMISTMSFAATVSFWAYGSDDSANHSRYLNTDMKGHKGQNISINYALGKDWTNISAHLWLKAVDDTCVRWKVCADGIIGHKDRKEKAVISNIEGLAGKYTFTEIDSLQWYDLNLDVTQYLLADFDNTFKARLRPNIHRDFIFKNAKLVIDYDLKPVPVPAAVWLFGSAIMGLVTAKKRKSL